METACSFRQTSISSYILYAAKLLIRIFVSEVNSNSWCGQCSAGVDPTLGFIAVNLTEDRFKLHHPYDLPPEQRYEFRDGVRRMWVYCTDKPFSRGSTTKPRSEILLNVYTN
jgi:hypothetical protein